MKLVYWLIFLLLFIHYKTFASQEDSARIIKMGYIEFPPMFSTNAGGNAQGKLIDLMEIVFKRANLQWAAIPLPTKRMTRSLITGEVDLWVGLATIPGFKDKTLVGKSNVLTLNMRAYHLNGTPQIKKKSDLSNNRVVIMRGYSYGGWIDFIKDPLKNVEYIIKNKHATAIDMIVHGRADYLLSYKSLQAPPLGVNDISGLEYSELSSLNCYFVVSKKSENAKQLLHKIETAYQQLLVEGKILRE